MFNLFKKRPLTVLEVLNQQLIRLHTELGSIVWVDHDVKSNKEYMELLRQIDSITQELIRLSKGTSV